MKSIKNVPEQPNLDYMYRTCSVEVDPEVKIILERLQGKLDRYNTVQKETGIPWGFVLALHLRESSCDFSRNLHNGEPLDKVTTKVPVGRGPFKTWEESAIDALKLRDIHVNEMKNTADWLLAFEKYNGLGYRKHGIYSPYLWSGTNWYRKGKFAKDGIFDPELVDKQIGIVPILKRLWV